MRRLTIPTLAAAVLLFPIAARAQRYTAPDGRLRVALAQQPFSPNGTVPGSAHDGERRHPENPRGPRRDRSRAGSGADCGGRHGVRRLEAPRHGARPLRRYRREERARGLLHRRPVCDVSVDAGDGRGTPALRPESRTYPDRHALARRASRFQHAGDDTQRIARRHAGRGRDRAGAAAHAARRASRPAALGSSHRDGRRAAHRSARAAAPGRFADRAGDASTTCEARRRRCSRSSIGSHA